MTTNFVSEFIPLIVRKAERLLGRSALHRDSSISDDPLPMFVRRRTDGVIVGRDTYITEVNAETTDDN